MDPAAEPFLTSKEEDGEDIHRHVSVEKPRASSRRTSLTIAAHLALMVVYAIVSWIVVRVYLDHHIPQREALDPAMADLTIKNEHRLFRNLTGNRYAGPPSDAIDEAWEELLSPMNMRASSEELRHENQESIALPENGGHLVWLGVFHELHCVKMLRKWVYRDHYHPNLTEEEERHWFSHADHCIDVLRQFALCHADLSLTVFKWDPRYKEPMFDASESVHSCMNWDALMESTAHRFVSDDEIRRVDNPLMKEGNKNKDTG